MRAEIINYRKGITFRAEISLVTMFSTSRTTPKAPTPKMEMTLYSLMKGIFTSLINTSSRSHRPIC